MENSQLRVMAVVGSISKNSVMRTVVGHVADELARHGCIVDLFDPVKEPLDLFNPDSAYATPTYSLLQKRVEAADVFILGTPDYHGCISSALKNFLDHFWQEFAGKLLATIVGSYEKGLTVTDQLRTMARQCYAWSLPYGVSFSDREDLKDGQIASPQLRQRLEMLVHDTAAYGRLIAEQRARDLEGEGPGFMAKYRRKGSVAQA